MLTVNDAYADLLEDQLRVPRPPVVMNCREIWTPPSPPPDLIREALGLPAETAVVLYQGILTIERGIEQAMDAILQVPSAVLVLMGFGVLEEAVRRRRRRARRISGASISCRRSRRTTLLTWSASADALVMAIQPTTLNHRYTTPQKLFESMAAGVPVVASDLPGMAPIVRATGAGVLCDPTSPASIAEAITSIVTASPGRTPRDARARLRAAHERYNWEAQLGTLFGLYRELLPTAMQDARQSSDRATGSG